jgi:hypothetical protein
MPEYPAHGSKYFDVREFVHPKTWAELGESPARCQWMIDPKVVRVCDLMRELVGGPVVVNDWLWKKSGKKFVSSGFRAKWDSTGAAYSQHRRGMAADLKCVLPPVSMLAIVQANMPAFLAAGLTTIEDIAHTPTWLHIDCRPRLEGSPDLLIIKPK